MTKKSSMLRGFSLVELLITLVIVSLITSAFVPVISKKLMSMTATINGIIGKTDGDNNSSSNMPPELNSQEVCDKLGENLMYLTAEQNGGKAACVTKANVGDSYNNGPEISSSAGVTVVKSETSCAGQSCCWTGNGVGTTAGSCTTGGNGDSTYSGCTRTVCTWAGAKAACENWEPVSGTKGKWRLPTKDELTAWSNKIAKIQNYQGKDGLELCDEGAYTGSFQCAGYSGACVGSNLNYCDPKNVWSLDENGPSYAYYYKLDNGSFGSADAAKTYAFSARCLIDEDAYKAAFPSSSNNNTPSGGGDTEEGTPIINKITSQADCDKLGDGLLFLTAEQNGGKRACVTKANVGDEYKNGPDLNALKTSAGITVVNAGSTCGSKSDYTSKCCWLGNNVGLTSETCTDTGNSSGTYSGCKRAVCTYEASKAACKAFEPTNSGTKGKWRLPNQTELSSWGSYLYIISLNKGESGLQLCDRDLNYGSAKCDSHTTNCKGAYGNYCIPNYLWATNGYDSRQAYLYYLTNGVLYSGYNYKTYALSARCILDEDAVVNGLSEDDNSSSGDSSGLPKKITSQEDCDKIGPNLKFLTAEQNYGRRACVTKANVGDSYMDGPDLSKISAGITVNNAGMTAGTPLDATRKYCWTGNNQGKTATNCTSNENGDSTYSGCKRTVCTYEGAKAACENWEPEGSKTKGKWRLPYKEEMDVWLNSTNLQALQINKGSNGLQLCVSTSGYGSVQCNQGSGCHGQTTGCFPFHLWAMDPSLADTSQAYRFYIDTKTKTGSAMYKHNAFSARCVLDEDAYSNPSFPTTLLDQSDCNKIGPNLKYLTPDQNGGTSACVTKANVGDKYMNGPDLDKIKSEAGITVITPGTVCPYNNSRTYYQASCCWLGNNKNITSGECSLTGNGDSVYSGCKRTVCTWVAANSACRYFEPTSSGTKGYWRLPKNNELSAWSRYIDSISKNQGQYGLELCDPSSGYNSVECSQSTKCKGNAPTHFNSTEQSEYGSCAPAVLWTSDQQVIYRGGYTYGDRPSSISNGSNYGSLQQYFRQNVFTQELYQGVLNDGFSDYINGFSARCVIDSAAVKQISTKLQGNN